MNVWFIPYIMLSIYIDHLLKLNFSSEKARYFYMQFLGNKTEA